MADVIIDETPNCKIGSFSKIVSMGSGGKLTDDASLVSAINKTIPQGYRVTAYVYIKFKAVQL